MSQIESATCPIYPVPGNDRVRELIKLFADNHGTGPDFLVRVPGRVNLIGEHIDYCGYGVCPMALEQDILLAVSSNGGKTLKLANTDKSYEDDECAIDDIEVNVGDGAPKWFQYVHCGIKGILDILPSTTPLRGLNILVNGTIPPSAGLSSSSALVSAAALATSYAHNLSLSKEKIASLCAECERYIGTQGGGMDQAIGFLATEGCAKYIEFSPLRCQDVVLPEGAVFVIAHSLAKMNKAATADFNCRVVECRLSAQIMAKRLGLNWIGIKRLGELQLALNANLERMDSLVNEIFHDEPYTKDEILKELEVSSDELAKYSLTPNTLHIESFKLKQRAAHVFKETLRVEKFIEECKNNRSSAGVDSLKILGDLMYQSHSSLRDLYECSHPQLDKLVEISAGLALGVRLTGAGWGGCAVALVAPDNVDKYMTTLKEKFYSAMLTDAEKEDNGAVLFATSPNAGACIYAINSAN